MREGRKDGGIEGWRDGAITDSEHLVGAKNNFNLLHLYRNKTRGL